MYHVRSFEKGLPLCVTSGPFIYLMSHNKATPLMVQCLGPVSLSKSMDPI